MEEPQERLEAVSYMLSFLGLAEPEAETMDRPTDPVSNPEKTLERQAPTLQTGGQRTAPVTTLPSIPGYRILRPLGQGGMGIVYQARHLKLNRLVALKMLLGERATDHHRARFRAESKAVARFQHPNIVQIFEVGEHQGQPYFALEFVGGGSLDRHIQGSPQLPRESAQLVLILAQTMQAAHNEGIIHRDLKPANVLMAGTEDLPLSQRVPKVTDFGLAKELDTDSGRTREGSTIGTPSYMAPEQAEGRIDDLCPGTDVWALGAILYELLTGRPPFKAQTVLETMSQVIAMDPVAPSRLNPTCTRDLELICLKCLNKRISDRYASARLLADDLDRWLRGEPISVRPAGRVERLVKWARRSPFQALAAAVSVAFVLALLGVFYAGMEAARKDSALARRDRDELQRREDLYARYTALCSQAENATAKGDWIAAERDAQAAIELAEAEPGFAKIVSPEPMRQLRAKARGKQESASETAKHRKKLLRLNEYHSDSSFFTTAATGLEQPASLARVRVAAREGLELFGVTADNDGPPIIDARFFSPEEARLITGACYELLLLDADALAYPVVGEKVGVWRERLREAIRLLDRADRLLSGTHTYSAIRQRAQYMEGLGDLVAVRQLKKEAETIEPSLAADHFLLGVECYKRGEIKKAQVALGNALRRQSAHFGARYLLGITYLQDKRWDAAKEALKACVDQRSEFPWPRLMRSVAAMELQEFSAAYEDLDFVLKSSDKMAAYVALVNRGALGIRQNRWDDAIADLNQAVTADPNSYAAYVNLALAYKQQAEYLPLQALALLAGPEGVTALLVSGIQRRQNRERAIAVLSKAIEQRPDVSRLYHERGRLHLLLNDSVSALADFRLAVAHSLNEGSALLANDLIEIGQLLHRGKKYRDAEGVYRVTLGLRSAPVLVHRLIADPLLAQRKYKEAAAELDLYLAVMPVASPGHVLPPEQARQLSEALKVRGVLHEQQKNLRAALGSYTKSLELVRDAEVLSIRGWAYLTYSAPHLAVEDFDEALKLKPNDGNALLGRADARVKLGRTTEALTDAEAGLRGAVEPRTFYNAARVYAQAVGKFDAVGGTSRQSTEARERALTLLREALTRTPQAERKAFWNDYVLKDSALVPLRQGSSLSALAVDVGVP